MNDHAEISRQLALAIGYPVECVRVQMRACHADLQYVEVYGGGGKNDGFFHVFDYRSPDVAMGVLEWLMRERGAWVPHWRIGDHYTVICRMPNIYGIADTLPLAIARAAIAVGGVK